MTYLEALTEAASNKDFVSCYDRLFKSNFGSVISATGIEKLIDESTGRTEAEVMKFKVFLMSMFGTDYRKKHLKNSINL